MKEKRLFSQEFKNDLLALFRRNAKRPLGEQQIAAEFALRGGARKRLRKLLNAMVREGAIVCVHQNHFGLGSPADLVTGELEIRRSGDGIITPPAGGLEVFIPRDDLSTALPADLVVARLVPGETARGGARVGKVIQILERARRPIVGTLRVTGRFYYVVPIDPVYERDFYVTDPKGARVNDRVVIRFTGWANRHVNPEAEIIESIGPENIPSYDTRVIIRHYGLADQFPAEVLREAAEAVRLLDQPGERRDFRDKYILTIDPATARDFDDAISLEKDQAGRRVLGVHIADVSHFIRPAGALDKEAQRRGTSVYFPDQVLPMLPEAISNGVCSLRPNEDRLTFSALITFDDHGAPLKADFCKSIIRSRLRLTYEQALAALPAAAGRPADLSPEAHDLLQRSHVLAQQLRQKRFAQFALNLDMPEYEIFIGRHGMIEDIRQRLSDISHQLIEEFMIAANEAVDRGLSERGYQIVHRVHAPPDQKKIEALALQLSEFELHPGNLAIRKNMAHFLEKIVGHPFEYDAKLATLKSMKRAVYAPELIGHYGLAKKYYAHFTSPIRRYPDLTVHRALAALLSGRENPYRFDALAALGRHCSRAEQMADEAEKALIEIKKYRFLEQQLARHKPEIYEAVVARVKNFGLFVELTRLQIQGLVHVSSISREFVRYDAHRQELRARKKTFRIGSRLKVFVTRVDFDKRQIDFALAGEEG